MEPYGIVYHHGVYDFIDFVIQNYRNVNFKIMKKWKWKIDFCGRFLMIALLEGDANIDFGIFPGGCITGLTLENKFDEYPRKDSALLTTKLTLTTEKSSLTILCRIDCRMHTD